MERKGAIMNKYVVAHLLLNGLSGFVELGAIIYVACSSQPLYYIPIMGLAYQTGALFREPIELATWHYYIALFLAMLLAVFSLEYPLSLFMAVFMLSVGIQGSRGIISGHGSVSTLTKRISRIAGFAFSGLFSTHILIIIVGIVLLIYHFIAKETKVAQKTSIRQNLKPQPLGLVMMIHQSHYFTYAYIIPLIIIYHEVNPRIVGLLFCIGWLSYVFSQKVFGEKKLAHSFAIGHVFAAITLAGLFFFARISVILLLLLWFLTGFGGGTVYCLRKLRQNSLTDKSDLDSWENIGHVLGVIICLLVLLIMKAPASVFLVASFIAIFTCLLFLITLHRKSYSLRNLDEPVP